jgi:hypothetical protein
MKTILDDALRRWEVYATTGVHGFPDRARIAFRCVSDPTVRARGTTLEGAKADAERALAERSEGELRELLRNATELA